MAQILLLLIIYLAFISLGLPDSILGVAWPTMRAGLGRPLEAAGIITVLSTGCSTLSSFMSGRVLGRFGTGRVVMVSCFMTGLALLGYSLVPSFGWLLVMTLPLGLGAGAVDAGLNHYVARHYSSRHMNWLHCCWGIGATLGPIIMTTALGAGFGWNIGFRIIAGIQLVLAIAFLISLRLWNEGAMIRRSVSPSTQSSRLSVRSPAGFWESVMFYFFYAATEFSIGLWSYSLMIESRGIDKQSAGFWIAMFYGAITVGRFLNGIVADFLKNTVIIRIGLGITLLGSIVFFFSRPGNAGLISLILLGLGLSPLYPCMMHETPRRFSPETSRRLIGYQVGSACIGASLVPAGIGLIAADIGLEVLPFFICSFLVLLIFMSERITRLTAVKA